jgi:hypothetical protein
MLKYGGFKTSSDLYGLLTVGFAASQALFEDCCGRKKEEEQGSCWGGEVGGGKGVRGGNIET